MREHEETAEKTKCFGNISAFPTLPWLGIDFHFLILVGPLNESF